MHPTELNLEDLVLLQKRLFGKQNKAMFSSNQAGGRLSHLKGRGMEFDEVRPYLPGDDIRQIDWKVTARTGTTHTKLYREERDRAVWVCADFSQSMFFATQKQYKSVLAGYFSAIQLWQAYGHKDRCGGIVFNEFEQYIIKPSSRKNGILHFLQKCVDMNNSAPLGEQKYNINQTVKELNVLNKTGSLIVLISDFYQLSEQGYEQILLLARHNEVVLQWIVDPFEMEIPQKDFTMSDGKKMVSLLASKKQVREQYQEPFNQLLKRLLTLAKHPSIQSLISSTKNGTDMPLALNDV